MSPAPTEGVRAVLFDLDDTLVPWQTVAHWQWAWRPMGPVLSERRTNAAIHRAVHEWDRRRWAGVVGTSAPADAVAYREFVAATLTEVAGHALPPAESDAVVGRFLKPAGEIETYADVAPAIREIEAIGCTVAVCAAMGETAARHALARAGLGRLKLVATADGPAPVVPAPAAFRAIAKGLALKPAEVLFVGDLFWSDVRAAGRAGLATVLLDRHDWSARALGPRVRSLGDLAVHVRHAPEPVRQPVAASPETPPGPPAEGGSAPG